MRIIHILSQKELTGAEVYALHLAKEQQIQGHEVQIISDQLHMPTCVAFESWSVHKPGFWTHRKNIQKLKHKLRQEQIHIVHCHSRAAVRLASAACRFLPTAQITTIHGRQHSSWSKKIFDIYGHRVLAICENVAEHLKFDFKMNPRKIFIVRNPFYFEKKNTDQVFEKKSITIALVGRTSGPKGEQTKEFMFHIFPQILQKFPQVKIDIVGRPISALGSEALAQISTLKEQYPQRFNTIENLSSLSEYWPACDIVIGAGRVALEALIEKKILMGLGEAAWEGEITVENFQSAAKSNFGDIGFPEKFIPLDLNEIQRALNETIEKRLSPQWQSNAEKILCLAQSQFESSSVVTEIERIYESAWWQKQQSRNIPILMYHKIVPESIQSEHKIFITQANFKKHLEYFKAKGFTTLTFKELAEFRKMRRPLSEFPAKPLVLTFDDGYKNNLDLAVPLLLEFKCKAVFFLLADATVKTNSWDNDVMPLMNPQERLKLSSLGFEVGSHGFAHQKITNMNPDQALFELHESKKTLESELGIDVITYAFAYGDTSLEMARQAQQAGYQYAVNTDRGGLHYEEDPYRIFRVNVFPQDGPAELRKKTASWYRLYYFLKRKK